MSIKELDLLAKTALMVSLVFTAGLARPVSAQSIYTCVDGKGRRLSADRPIVECLDRTQKELTSSGTTVREVGPSLTLQERAVQEVKDRQVAEQRVAELQEKRRNRALIARYPNRGIHDQERAKALLQVDEVSKSSGNRTEELALQRRSIENEFEFYVRDPSHAPAGLKRRQEENKASLLIQKKFVEDQEQERARVNRRFDEDLIKLRPLWVLKSGVDDRGGLSPAPNLKAENRDSEKN